MGYQAYKGSKYYGVTAVFENIQLEIRNARKIATAERNGCGKTMLLWATAETEVLDTGEIHKEDKLRIGYLAQTTFMGENVIVEEEMEQAFEQVKAVGKRLKELSKKIYSDHSEAVLNVYADVQQRSEELGGYTYRSEMMTIFTKFGFQEEDLKRPISTFFGSQKTRLAFVKLPLSKPDVLSLDEPTNHLDVDTIEWLEGYVKRYPKVVVLAPHDCMFLDDVVDVVYETEYGIMQRHSGNYSNYVNVKKSDLEQQKSAYIHQQKETQRMEELTEKLRYKKNKAAFVQPKIKYPDHMERIEDPRSNEKSFSARFVPNVEGGKRALEVQDLAVGCDQSLCTASLEVTQPAKIVVIRSNGKGKSAFMKTLMRWVEPLSDSFLPGRQIEAGYLDQELAQLNSVNTVLKEVWNDFPDLNRTKVRIALGCSPFAGEEVFKIVDCLSGGEKACLSFVKLILSHPNFLLMDEPTNHLNLIEKEALEESLKDYEGTMLLVSHDCHFISKLVIAILVIDDDKTSYYPLTYKEYMNGDKAQPVEGKQQLEKKESAKLERYINYGREISELERKIVVEEEELEVLRELRSEPEYYHDYHKMQELDEKTDLIHNEVENLM